MNVIGSTRVVAAFPGCGKTTMSSNCPEICDLDSSFFDKSQFPGNYIDAIKEKEEVGAVFVSSHKLVRDALTENGINFWLIYPAQDRKAEFLQRYRDRGSPEKFIELMDANWDAWISECKAQPAACRIEIPEGYFLEDVIGYAFDQKRFIL